MIRLYLRFLFVIGALLVSCSAVDAQTAHSPEFSRGCRSAHRSTAAPVAVAVGP
jgi:hypothetical protein